MRELPILCAASVVRAILEGRQTQDRRPVKDAWRLSCYVSPPTHIKVKPPWSPGDILYVRETWRTLEQDDGTDGILYPADGSFIPIENTPDAADLWGQAHDNGRYGIKYRPSIHMPKWASRIRLRVLSVRCARVNAIGEEDARAEGVADVAAFRMLWDSLYGVGSFDAATWCWVTEFEVVR